MTLLIKYILSSTMIIVSIFQIILNACFTEDSIDIQVTKYILFSLSIIAWISSVIMLRLELKFRLVMN